MRILITTAIVSALVLQAGCAVLKPQHSAAAGAAVQSSAPAATTVATHTEQPSQAQQAPEEPELPAVKLSGALLYDVLSAEFASERGDYIGAAKGYLDLARKTQDQRLAELATRNAAAAHDHGTLALDAVREWISLSPKDAEAHEFAASLYLGSGDTTRALDEMHQVLALDTQDDGFVAIAAILSREPDKDAAMKVMKQFMAEYGGNADAQYAFGYVAFRKGDLDTAMKAMDAALKLRPDWTRAIVFRAHLLSAQGNPDAAVTYLKDSVARLPKEKDLRFSYARALLSAKRVEQAYAQFKKVLALSPDDSDILFTLGVLGINLNYADEAEHYLERDAELQGRSDDLSYFLGQALELKKDYAKAIHYYSQVEGGQYFFDARVRRADLQAKEGDLTAARSGLHNLRVLMPQRRVDTYLAEGDILRQAEKYDAAVAVYNHGLKEFPDNRDLLYARAFVAAKLDRIEMAERDLLNIIHRDPNNAEALNALGYTLADRTTRYEEALKYIQRALKLRPDDYFVLDSMGWVQYRLGNYDEALKYLKRAMQASNDTEVAAHLGEVLWAMGHQDQARDVWHKALKAEPNSKPILEVMKRLEP